MKIKYLSIVKFKNLKNFELNLENNEQNTLVTIGKNGTGKSNLLEAIVLIFRNLFVYEKKTIKEIEKDLMRKAGIPFFEFTIIYECNNHIVKIHFEDTNRSKNQINLLFPEESNTSENYAYKFSIKKGENFKEIIKNKFFEKQDNEKDKYSFLPAYIFAYYSGVSNRLEQHFDYHQKQFYDELLAGVDKPFRPLFYARPIHSNFVLLAFYAFQDDNINEFLESYLNISGLNSSLFVIREPGWKSKEGDIRFWKAKGVVSKFLSNLFSKSLAPIRDKVEIRLDFRHVEDRECWYLFLESQDKLKSLAQDYGSNVEFFKVLESTYISNLIHETRIKVQKKNSNGSITFKELSEGEQQLITVLGLLKFTNHSESLFLLDEPDTHLSPIWGHEYLRILQNISGRYSNSQMFLSTHKSMTVSGLEKEQVLIFKKTEDDNSIVDYPVVSPKGLSSDGVLTQVFGMEYTYDDETYRNLINRRVLFAKKQLDPSNFTNDDAVTLQALTEKVSEYLPKNYADGLFYEFINELEKIDKNDLEDYKSITLTDQEKEERRNKAINVLEKLKQKRSSEK